jgi:ankyrin
MNGILGSNPPYLQPDRQYLREQESAHELIDACYAEDEKKIRQLVWQRKLSPGQLSPYLFTACAIQSLSIARLFIDMGASVNCMTPQRNTLLGVVCLNGNFDLIQLLVSKGVDVTFPLGPNKKSPLHSAIHFQRFDHISYFLTIKPELVKAKDAEGLTPLHEVAGGGNVKIAQMLVEAGAEIEAQNEDGLTPLMEACCAGHDDLVEWFLQRGVNVNHVAKLRSYTPFLCACEKGHVAIAQTLKKAGARMTATTSDDQSTALHLGCASGNVDLVRWLLRQEGMEMEAVRKDGYTPLFCAVYSGNRSVVNFLIARGANLDAKASGLTLEEVAKQHKHEGLVEHLKRQRMLHDFGQQEYPLPPVERLYLACEIGNYPMWVAFKEALLTVEQHKKTWGSTLLHKACEGGNYFILLDLLRPGSDLEVLNQEGETPLHLACRYGHEDVALVLLKREASPHSKNHKGQTPIDLVPLGQKKVFEDIFDRHAPKFQSALPSSPIPATLEFYREDPTFFHKFCKVGNVWRMEQSLEQDPSFVHARDAGGTTALHMACEGRQKEALELLLHAGAKINQCDHKGSSPLHVACQAGFRHGVYKLLTMGAALQVDYVGKNLFHSACEGGDFAIIEKIYGLLPHALNVPDRAMGLYPLHYACVSKSWRGVGFLLMKKACIHVASKDGMSPFHEACRIGVLESVQLLFDAGADIHAPAKQGATPLHIAGRKGHLEVARFLLEKGVSLNEKAKDDSIPLHWACEGGNVELVRLLLTKMKEKKLLHLIEAKQTGGGTTPICIACHDGNRPLVELLLEHGALLNLRMQNGLTPIELARLRGHKELAGWLEKRVTPKNNSRKK